MALSGVLVVNVSNGNKTITDENGYFSFQANSGNELRFVRENYERVSLKILGNFILEVEMKYSPNEIEIVVLKYKPTGNLKEDSKHYGAPKKDIKLSEDLGKYVRNYSSREVLKPKVGEFVQPKGPGFETSKKGYQWKIYDVEIKLERILGEDYFLNMGLGNYQISSFINFVFKHFDTDEIRRFGRLSSSDIAHFQAEAERQLLPFKSQFNKK